MKRSIAAAIALIAALAAGWQLAVTQVAAQAPAAKPAPTKPAETQVATFAGGCFWCVEADYDKVEGVISTVSGYMGGRTPNPTYEQVSHGNTGHLEVVQVTFDPTKVSYKQLVDYFWRHVDAYDNGGQFCDRGESYKTAIFTNSPEQKAVAEATKAELAKSGPLKEPVATVVRDAGPFTAAEDYHQDYYTKNPVRYKYYRFSCGRDQRIEAIWGKKASH